MRISIFAASSRLTVEPISSCASEVSESVWTMTSAVKLSAIIEVAVKHVPFTAIESPRASSSNDLGALIVKSAELSPRAIWVTVPSSVISPVNI